jgi:hypothetical protein
MAQMAGQLDIVQHTENLQNIDRSELQGLFMQLMQFADTQFDSSGDGQSQGQLMQAINQFGVMAMSENKNQKRGGNQYEG